MKTIALNRKYLKYLFWLSPVLIIMGLSAGAVAGSWGPIPLTLIGLGIVILGLWLWADAKSLPGFFNRRSTQAGTNALVTTLAVLVILGLINFLGVRYAKQVDLTENQLFTLAPQTQEVLQDLEQPVKLWIFDIRQNPPDQRLLDNYQRENNLFSYEYVNPEARPGLARDFEIQNSGEVYLEQGETRRQLIQDINQEPLTERKLTNGIIQITSDRQAKVYFVQGHGERSLEAGQGSISQAIATLSDENYVAEPLNLTQTSQVPDDASVVVVAGPQRELLAAEVAALEAYLEKKSGLLLLLDPETDPGLEPLLQDWGVQLDDRLIIDPSGQAVGVNAAVTIVTQYGPHPITEEFQNDISFYPLARALDLTEEQDIQAEPFLFTGDRVQAKAIPENGELAFDPNQPPQGPFMIGVALSRPITESSPQPSPSPSPSPEATASPTPQSDAPDADEETATEETDEEEAPEARLVVIGNSSFATDGLFDQQLNGDVFLNSVSWLSQQDGQTLSIRPKEATNRRILMSPQQQIIAALTSLVVLPLVGFGAATVVWLRRR